MQKLGNGRTDEAAKLVRRMVWTQVKRVMESMSIVEKGTAMALLGSSSVDLGENLLEEVRKATGKSGLDGED